MAASAGLRPQEADQMPFLDVWLMIRGHEKNVQIYWEIARALAYNVAVFGNSDKKRLARSPKQFWHFPWDEPEDMASKYREIMIQHAKNRALREHFKNN